MNRAALILFPIIGAILVFAACGDAKYTLKTAVGPHYSGGTVSLVPAPGPDGTYSSGTVVKLTAGPSIRHKCLATPYWSFAGWSGDVQGSTRTVEIIMDSDKSVTAGFSEFFPRQCPPACKEPTLEISMSADALRFDQDKLQAAAGTEVVLCVRNVSGILHNWVLVRLGTKDAVVARGSQHHDNGWVQPEDPDVIAHTRLLDPGQEVQISFTAPPLGTYHFVCTFPGHNAGGMSGEFVVGGDFTGDSTEDEGIRLIKSIPEYKSLVDKFGSDHVSVKAVNLEDRDEADFLRTINDGFLMDPGCIIVLKAEPGEGYVYQLDEEFNVVFRMTLSGFEQGARAVDSRTMVEFYASLR